VSDSVKKAGARPDRSARAWEIESCHPDEKTSAKDSPMIDTPRRIPRFVAAAPVAVGVSTAAVGGLVLVGWWLGVDALKSVTPGLPWMAPNTAVGLIASGLALGLLRTTPVSRPRRRLAGAGAAVAVLIGLLTLAEYVLDRDLLVDRLLFSDSVAADPSPTPGRPAFPTALALVLVGSALGLLDARRGSLAQGLGLLAALIALLALLGFVAGVRSFYGVVSAYPNSGMAVHTAVAIVLLGAGIITARPDRSLMAVLLDRGAAGTVARWLLAVPVALPLVTGLARQEGQRLGWYHPDFGGWAFSLSNITIFTLIIWRVAGMLRRSDAARIAAEAETRRLNAELEERVRARTAELAEANRSLAQKNAENEMFVYSVSHDLRSPLVNLQGFSKELEKAGRGVADLLGEDGVPPGVRERGRQILDRRVGVAVGFIQSAVMRVSGIIDALLRLSRAGRVEYRWAAVDVAELVGRVVAAAQGTIAERGATVRVGALPPAWGDGTAIEQVFGNLVGNALAYLDPTRPGEVEVGALAADPEGGVTYFVRDNGLGIAEGLQARIFQAFQRAHPGVGSGEGLGLAIVSRVVERHRGRVWVESLPGRGSTFYVGLPPPASRAAT
jgi:signal transduction histidine kinase